MKFHFILLSVLLIAGNCASGQSAQEIKSSCEKELQALKFKSEEATSAYEQLVSDLRAGLFCSECGVSKSQFEKRGQDFYAHIADGVKSGRHTVAATKAQFQNAYNDYIREFNAIKNQYENKRKSCNYSIDMAVKQENERAQREKEEAEEKRKEEQQRQIEKENEERAAQKKQQEEQLRKQQDQQRQLAERQKAAREAAEKQRAAEIQRQEAVRQELQRQRDELDKKILADAEKNKEDTKKRTDDFANEKINEIARIEMPAEKIGFGNSNSENSGSEKIDLKQIKNNSGSVDDDFDMSNIAKASPGGTSETTETDRINAITDYEEWHRASVAYLESKNQTANADKPADVSTVVQDIAAEQEKLPPLPENILYGPDPEEERRMVNEWAPHDNDPDPGSTYSQKVTYTVSGNEDSPAAGDANSKPSAMHVLMVNVGDFLRGKTADGSTGNSLVTTVIDRVKNQGIDKLSQYTHDPEGVSSRAKTADDVGSNGYTSAFDNAWNGNNEAADKLIEENNEKLYDEALKSKALSTPATRRLVEVKEQIEETDKRMQGYIDRLMKYFCSSCGNKIDQQ